MYQALIQYYTFCFTLNSLQILFNFLGWQLSFKPRLYEANEMGMSMQITKEIPDGEDVYKN